MATGKSSAENQAKISVFDGWSVIDLSDLSSKPDSVSVRLSDILGFLNMMAGIDDGVTGRIASPKLQGLFRRVHNGGRPEIENFLYNTIVELGMNVKDTELRFTAGKSSCGVGDDGFNILKIDSTMDWNSVQFITLHELRHIQQVQRGWLTHDNYNKSFWKGREVECNPRKYPSNLAYNMAPQELDANIFALEYFKGDCSTVNNGENAIGIARSYRERLPWFESIGVP